MVNPNVLSRFAITFAVLFLSLAVVSRAEGQNVAEGSFAVAQTPHKDAIVITRAGKVVVQYQLQKPSDSSLSVESACYFHPLQTPRGITTTDVAPSDHLHHRGIFLGWVEMHGKHDADFWGWGEHAPTKDRRIVNVGVSNLRAGAESAAFRAENEWRAGQEVMIVEQLEATVRFVSPAYVLDLAYRLTPRENITLARWAFSGFCVRVPKNGRIEAEAPDGPVTLPDPKHTEPTSDWPAAPWYGYTLQLPDGAASVAVVDHPANPPSLWHNHRGVRMLNPCIVAPGPVNLKVGEPLLLRYRVVAGDGALSRPLLRELRESWVTQK